MSLQNIMRKLFPYLIPILLISCANSDETLDSYGLTYPRQSSSDFYRCNSQKFDSFGRYECH